MTKTPKFGGVWTEKKLKPIGKYLKAFVIKCPSKAILNSEMSILRNKNGSYLK